MLLQIQGPISSMGLTDRMLVIMRGAPGEGKSTLAQKIVNRRGRAQICSADSWYIILGNGTYKYDPRQIGAAHAFCFGQFLAALNQHTPLIIIDNTNMERWNYARYVDLALARFYKVYQCRPDSTKDANELIIRNIHGVPLEYIKQSLEKFEVDETLEHFPIGEVA